MKPAIGWDNAAVSFSSPSAALAFNGLTYDGWEAANNGLTTLGWQTVGPTSYVAIARHNLAGTNMRIFRGSTSILVPVPTSAPVLVRLPLATGTFGWALEANTPGRRARINVIHAGRLMEFPRGIWSGHSPIQFSRRNRLLNNLSESGQLIGRKVIAEGAATTINVSNVPSDWVRENWNPFLRAIDRRGFFWQHNPTQYPLEVAYCWTSDDPSATNARVGGLNRKGYMDLSLTVSGIIT